MKTIKLKYDKTARDIYIGQRGEHRMTRITLPLPKARLPDIQSAVAIFDCDGVPRLSPILEPDSSGDAYLQDGIAYITLTRSLTCCKVLRIQLECYGTDGEFIDRSPISGRLKFEDSLVDCLDDLVNVPGEPDTLEQLIRWMHNHPNKSVLDAFTADENGVLHWNGAALAKDADLQAEAETRSSEDGELWDALPEALTNMEIDGLINQALLAIKP